MGIFSKLLSWLTEDNDEPAKVDGAKLTTHKVAGTSYRQDAIRAMGEKNPDYNLAKRKLVKQWPEGITVYEYKFHPQKAELVPEPENPENPKAIKVLVDGIHVGYIRDGSCAHIHRLIKENRIQSIVPKIIGGKYKEVYALDQDARKVEDYEVGKGETTIGVRLEITELPATNR